VGHARLRRQLGPAFSGKGIEEIEPVLQQYIDLMITQLQEASREASQDMTHWISWVLNDVIGDLAMGTKFDCLKTRRYHVWPGFMLRALKAVATLNQLRRFGLSEISSRLVSKKYLQANDEFRTMTIDNTRERLKQIECENGTKRADFVSLMLREMKNEKEPLSDLDIAANTGTLVAAGSETTSVLLNGLIFYLAKTERVKGILQQEVRKAFTEADDITIKTTAKLEYLQAVIEEGLRMFGPAAMVPARITPKNGHVIDGQHIPPNVRGIRV
jgi:cytochrome P450